MKISNYKRNTLIAVALSCAILSCDKANYPVPLEEYPKNFPNQSFKQDFDSKSAAETQGWNFLNLSDEAHGAWAFKSAAPGFTPQAGAQFLYSDYTASGADLGSFPDAIISNWAISPKVIVQNGDKVSFWAKSIGSVDGYGDRIQLRMTHLNATPGFTDSSATDVGNFLTPLVDINPLYRITSAAFPETWTKYEATISGMSYPDTARFAIRYFVQLNGGANGDAVGVDSFEFTSSAK